jgi:citrate lyase subunit beta / citryl-CoA lyase
MTHPNVELFESGKSLPIIPSCEHFAGSEKLISKAFEMQRK